MDIEKAKEKLKNPNKKNLIDVIRIFKRNGIENYCITEIETIKTVLLELEKKDRIIELMAKEIEFRTGNCPYGTYNYDLDCKKRCNNNYKECWIEYFTKKVEGR